MNQSPTDLGALVAQLDRFEEVVSGWEASQKATVHAMKDTIEEIHAEAMRRLIRAVKEDPGGLAKLAEAAQDPWVNGVLAYHGLIRAPEPSIEDRIEQALESVRPSLASHAGDVELVSVELPEVQVRLLGSCDGCSLSAITVRNGVETAIKEAVPEVEKVVVVESGASKTRLGPDPADSPFQRPFEDAAALDDIPEGEVMAVELQRSSVLLTRVDGTVKAYPNACTHLGMPLDTSIVTDGVLTCRYHGFKYRLDTGECLTAPEVALPAYPARVVRGRVLVQVTT